MSHGKRYTVKERKEILVYLENHTYQETMEKFGVSQMSLARWVKNKEKRETNTTTTLLNAEVQKEVQIYLKLVESMKNVRAVAIVTAAGELILPNSASGFHSIFSNVNDITVIISNLLLCAQGFTAAAVKDQKQMNAVFDDVSIKTPIGTFLLKGIERAVLVILFNPGSSLSEIFIQEFHFINQIVEQLSTVF